MKRLFLLFSVLMLSMGLSMGMAWGVGPTITAGTVAADNSYIDVDFSAGVWGDIGQLTPVDVSYLTLVFTQNGGHSTNVAKSSIKQNDNVVEGSASALLGGETTIRVFLTVTLLPSGVETIAIHPVGDALIYDAGGLPVLAASTTGLKTLNDQVVPVLSTATVENAAPSALVLTYSKTIDAGSVPANGDFAIGGADAGGRTVTGVAIATNKVTLTLSAPLLYGKVITVSYTKGVNPIQDAFGNDAANLVNQAVTDNVAPAPEIDITGNAVSIVSGDVTPSVVDWTNFGNAEINVGFVVRTFTIANSGSGVLTLLGTPKVDITGPNSGEFSLVAEPTSPVAAGGGTTTFQVKFDPSAAGVKTATLTIGNNDGNENLYVFTIQGTGVLAPEIDVKGNNVSIANDDATPSTTDFTDFGNVTVNTGSLTRTFTIANLGSANLNLSNGPIKAAVVDGVMLPAIYVHISGANVADFSLTQDATTPVGVSGSTTFNIKFIPSATGLRAATITIYNNDTDEDTYEFDIQGTGTVVMASSLSLMTPNGGESWASGSQQWIVWNSQNITYGMIEYSMNNGTSWITIPGSVNMVNGSYLWTVPAGGSPIARVRISGGGKTAASAAAFSITSTPPVTVTDITIIPAPASKVASGGAVPSGNYLILVDLNVPGTVQNVKVITWAKTGTTSLAVQEYYGTRDADSDGDIDTLTGSVSDVTVGKFTLPAAGTVSVGVTAIVVATVSYYNTAYQEDVTIVEMPTEFNVSGFYPNPFNPITNIQYSVPEDSPVTLAIYDISGRLVATLVNEYVHAGTYTAAWNARDESGNAVSTGLYLYRMTAGSFSAQGKVMFLK